MTPTEIYLIAAIIGALSAVVFMLLITSAIKKLADTPPADPLAQFIQENNKQLVYWKNAGNEEYAAAHQMLINAFTQVKSKEDGKQL
jgi:hypothetical protein